MRTLFVAPKLPYPPDTGGRQRLWHTLMAVAETGDVDVLVLSHLDADAVAAMERKLPNAHVTAAAPIRKAVTAQNVARCLAQRRVPTSVWFQDLTSAARTLDDWAQKSYGVVWDACPLASTLLADQKLGPVIVDRYDLEEEWLRGQARAEKLWRSPLRFARTRLDIKRWTQLNDQRGRGAARVLVCSETDRARADAPNMRVIPNGYERPTEPLGRLAVGNPPTLLLQGQMTYEPNVDAAVHFVESVFPKIRSASPNVQLRIVGRCEADVAALAREPNVTVTGYVPRMEDELARSDVVVVPLRYGSGTRIKLLEAFAHRIPAVSTTVGAEGLAVDETHLMLVDDDDGFANACLRLLDDLELRQTLAERAEQLYLDRYQWSQIRAEVTDLVRCVAREPTSTESG